MKTSLRWSAWSRLAVVVAVLGAPAALADRTQCEADCGGKAGSTLADCVEKCPQGGADAACTTRCVERFQQKFNECSKRCPERDNIESPRKTKSSRSRK